MADPVRPLVVIAGAEAIAGLALLIAAQLVLGYAANPVAYLAGVVLWGLHMGFSQGLLGAMIAGATPDGLRGRAFGAFNLVTGGVMLIGNVAAGWIWQMQGAQWPFLIGAGIAALAVLLLTRARPF